MTRPILVFGAGGRVGGEVWRTATNWPRPLVIAEPTPFCDIRDTHEIARGLAAWRPAAIINLAACTLPRAEMPDVAEEAYQVNTMAPAAISEIAALTPMVFISTDCVFGGSKDKPYHENDIPDPINHYGSTKLMGEFAVRRNPGRHIIIRTTGVYLADKPNFLKLVLDKARAGDTLECVSDSIYSPTDARELAQAILLATERVIEDPSVSGTYHFAGPDVMSYLEFARLVQEEAGVSGRIKPVTMADREAVEGFKRPRNASLNSDKFAQVFGLRHRPTRECVRELVQPR